MIFSVFQKNWVLGILGPPYCGRGATIRIGQEMLCLPYAGFFLFILVCFGICATVRIGWEIQCLPYAGFVLSCFSDCPKGNSWNADGFEVIGRIKFPWFTFYLFSRKWNLNYLINLPQLSGAFLGFYKWKLNKAQWTEPTAHCTLYTEHYTMYTANWKIYTAHGTIHKAQHTEHLTHRFIKPILYIKHILCIKHVLYIKQSQLVVKLGRGYMMREYVWLP